MRIINISLFILFFSNSVLGQSYVSKFNSLINSSNNVNSFVKVLRAAEIGNSMQFLYLGYNINARNTMYKATKDISYLRQNHEIIMRILHSGAKNRPLGDSTFRWLAKSSLTKDKGIMNKEVMLYEGYLFRYIAEYCYILNGLNLSLTKKQQLNVPFSFVENTYFKWYNKLTINNGFIPDMFGIRTHIGSHWATIAMYLYKFTDDPKKRLVYEKYFNIFDQHLKQNLISKSLSGKSYYVWNSSWNEPFTKNQIFYSENGDSSIDIQDVAHGNHIIQYVIDSYNLGLNNWTRNDLLKFSNTLLFSIWDPNTKSFKDNVDGTESKIDEFKNTGWKQSDGWMKLMLFNNNVYELYRGYYLQHENSINKNYYNLQIYANFQYYLSKNR